MATANPSLFGMLGDEAAMQRQLDEERAAKFAEMTQEQRLASMGYKAGAGVGRALAGAFGVDSTDPMIVEARAVKELSKDMDQTDPEAWKKLAVQLQSKGFAKSAGLAAQQYATLAKSAVDIRKTAAEASAKEGEVTGKEKRVAMLKAAGLSEEDAQGIASSDTAYSNYLKAKKVETPSEYGAVAGSLGFGVKPYLAEYSQPELAAIESRLQQKKVEAAKAGAATNVQESAFSKKLGELQAQDLTDTKKTAVSSAAALKTLENMEGPDNVYGGPLAGANITASQFLGSLGLLSESQARILANSEVYDKDAKKLVLQDLGGKLGAQISDKDREFIEATIPQLKNSPAARQRLVAKLKEIHTANIENYRQMQVHANEFGNLNKFDPTKLYGYGSKTSSAPALKEEDKQALAWADANPNDPRAAQIKQRLGK